MITSESRALSAGVSGDWLGAEMHGARLVIALIVGLIVALSALAILGRVDQVAVAPGRVVPSNPIAGVQARHAGVVSELLVRDGERVEAGQTLVRIDPEVADAAATAASAEFALTQLALERVDAELNARGFAPTGDYPVESLERVASQFRANLKAFRSAEAEEQRALRQAESEQRVVAARVSELDQTLARLREEETALANLLAKGFVARHLVLAKERERIAAAQGLEAARHQHDAAREAVARQRQRLARLDDDRRRDLETERVALIAQRDRLLSQTTMAENSRASTRLVAPIAGTVKDLAISGSGSVVSAGQILLTVVPIDSELKAEVWVENQDAARIAEGQPVRLKVEAIDFQRYGTLNGVIETVAADASSPRWSTVRNQADGAGIESYAPDQSFRVIVALPEAPGLADSTRQLRLAPGMRVSAEIVTGDRSVAEYLLSPVTRVARESMQEAG
jgi:HlyD family secretion protein